jgi:hypothetical protein
MIYRSIYIILYFVFSFLVAKDYKGAELRTIDSYVYGRFEVCYKSVKGSGTLATFFLYHDFTTSTADWNEIDLEILGRYSDDLQFTTITPYQSIQNSHTYVNFNPADDYHVYAFEWTPDYVAWFVDGEELYRQTGDHISTLTRAQKIMMNIWAPDNADSWTGEWNPDILPLFAYYDWVSYAVYTPGVGNTGTDNNFLLSWRDDFDNFDTDRWQTATHTWNGNRVDFTPENVIFKDGKLILCLTDAQNTGFMDNQAPVVLWARADGDDVIVQFSEELDSISAVNLANYGIGGTEITGIVLESDKSVVILSTSGIEAGQSYTLVAFNMKDASAGGNVRSQSITQVINNLPLSYPIRINVGGDAIYSDKYLADQIWLPQVEYGRMDGWIENWVGDISGTDEDLLFQKGCSELVKYKVRVSPGTYLVKLMMAENRLSQVGERVFSVVVKGNQIATDLDIIKEVGQHTAYQIIADNVVVNDGILDIHFSNWINKPLLNGIIIENKSTKIKREKSSPPGSFKVMQNYPNPFNPTTLIEYNLPALCDVSIDVYNHTGQLIESMPLGTMNAGNHLKEISLNIASGVYFYRLSAVADNMYYSDVKKMVVLK